MIALIIRERRMGWIERKARCNDTRLPDASLRAEDEKRRSGGGSENMKHQHAHTRLRRALHRAKRRDHILSAERVMTHIHHSPRSGKHLPQSKMRDEAAVRSSLETPLYCIIPNINPAIDSSQTV